jgi:putative aminopeptidase FrvX
LVRHFTAVAESEAIPCQMRQPGGGATDARAMHVKRMGIPSLSISMPCRHIHTAISVARLEDWKNTLYLLSAGLMRLSDSL